jgi:DNA processing protein
VTDADRDRLARVGLGQMSEPGDVHVARLVGDLGASAALEAVVGGDAKLWSLDRLADRLARLDPVQALDRAERAGARFVVPGDLGWPTQLWDLTGAADTGGAPTVPPLGLWVRGVGLPVDRGSVGLRSALVRSAAVVGSRAASAYGTRVASELAAGLADRGWAVVSGGA